MLSVKDAETIIFNHVQPLNQENDLENVDLLTAFGRVLATPVISSLDFPHWDNSAMDGFAVRYEDVQNSNSENPTILEIIEEIPAGYQPRNIIKLGQAARIFTGAVIPKGA
ncbi:MAG: molybdopterin molybdenumtransferase MoeA, partial [Dolichospermum sp.]